MVFLDVLIVFLAISFIYYGWACIFTKQMVEEFERYGFPRYRNLIGTLEVLGAVGLLVGYFVPIVQIMAAAGLALLMVSGCLLRIKIRDSLVQIAPAFTFLVLSLLVLYGLQTG